MAATVRGRHASRVLGGVLIWLVVASLIPQSGVADEPRLPKSVILSPLDSEWVSYEVGAGMIMEYEYEAEVIPLQPGAYNLDPLIAVHILDPEGNIAATHRASAGSGRITAAVDGVWRLMLVNFERDVKLRVFLHLRLLSAGITWPSELPIIASISSGVLVAFAYVWGRGERRGGGIERDGQIIFTDKWVDRSWTKAGILIQRYV